MDDENKDFMLFYKNYPRKQSPGQAMRTWIKLEKKGVLPNIEVILEALKKQKEERRRLGRDDKQFIQYPSTWLNAYGWMNEVTDEADAGSTAKTKSTTASRAKQAADALASGYIGAENRDDGCSIVATYS